MTATPVPSVRRMPVTVPGVSGTPRLRAVEVILAESAHRGLPGPGHRRSLLGGHPAVRDRMLDDLGPLRSVKACGERGGVAEVSGIARCRRYTPRRPVPAAALLTVAALLAVTASGCSAERAGAGTAAQAALTGTGATRTTPPPTQVAAGAVVSGFPSRLVPLPPGTTVRTSAVQRHGDLVDVSVSAVTAASAQDLLAFYGKALTAAGFSQTRGSMLPAGATGLAFARDGGRELLVLAVVDRRWSRSFSLGGTVAASG